jgi:putative flippase GtrA
MARRRILNRRTSRQFMKFMLVGGSTFVLEFLLFLVLEGMLRLPVVSAHLVSFVAAASYNFALNRRHVFTTRRLAVPLAKYAAVAAINAVLGSVLISRLALTMSYALSKLITIVVIACWNFILYKLVVFDEGKETEPASLLS